MKQTIKRCMTALFAALVFMVCIGGVAANAGSNRDVEDCFPDGPVYTPDMPEYHCKQGDSYYGQAKYDLAIASFEKALEIDPSCSNGYYGLAFTYRAQGRLDLALENYGEVIRLIPEYAQPYASRAEIYQFIGRFSDAEKRPRHIRNALWSIPNVISGTR